MIRLIPTLTLLLSLLVTLFALSACAPQSLPAQPVAFATAEHPLTLSERYDLKAYPGTGIYRLEDHGTNVQARFRSNADLVTLMGYFESQLARNGWFRVGPYVPGMTYAEVTYGQGKARFRLSLRLERPSGVYYLEIR